MWLKLNDSRTRNCLPASPYDSRPRCYQLSLMVVQLHTISLYILVCSSVGAALGVGAVGLAGGLIIVVKYNL